MTLPHSDDCRPARLFRFNMRRLLLVTTLVAVVTGTAWRLDWPEAARAALAAYLLFLLVWPTIVLPTVFRDYQRRKRGLAEQRAELQRLYGGPSKQRIDQNAGDDHT